MEALFTFYNKKTRFGLEWSKLYAKKNPAAFEKVRLEEESNRKMELMPETARAGSSDESVPQQMDIFSYEQ